MSAVVDSIVRSITFLLFLTLLMASVTSSSELPPAGALFQRVNDQPHIAVRAGTWYERSVANAGVVVTPTEVLLFLRGNAVDTEGVEHSQIGLFHQPRGTFSPDGPWEDLATNPVLPIGAPGDHDELHVLDCAPVLAPTGEIVMYYSATKRPWDYSIGGAVSTDFGRSFSKFSNNPLKWHSGVSDVAWHKGQFFLFYPDALWDPDQRQNQDVNRIRFVASHDPTAYDFTAASIAVSPGHGTWDMYTVGGGRVFPLAGKWWLIYQGSDTHWDYPYRFHAAWSEDLQTWTKVDSDQPLFTRGPAEAWDQGAIWHAEILEWEGHLYMYYEGWGSPGYTHIRNQPYYQGGCSQVGLATCSVQAFLEWARVGLE